MLKESSELREVFSLFNDLIQDQEPEASSGTSRAHPTEPGQLKAPDHTPFPDAAPQMAVSVPPAGEPFPAQPPAPVEGAYRGERLENVLEGMCRRGGFRGALLSDPSGLPIAAYHSPAEVERVAAFTSILGEALGQAERFLGQQGSGHLSMDVGYEDKLVIHRIPADRMAFFLTILCRQEIDERGEIELSVPQLTAELGEGEAG